jgi:hypothetical protein
MIPSNWVFREIRPDYGVDCEVELATTRGELTGDRLFFQVKASRSRRQSFRVSNRTLIYWHALPAPVIFVFVHVTSGETRFVDIQDMMTHDLSRSEVEREPLKTSKISLVNAGELPMGLPSLIDIALSRRLQREYAAAVCDPDPMRHIVAWIILRDMFSWDVAQWIGYLREKGSREQLLFDLPMALWMKDLAETHPGYVDRAREILDAFEGKNPELRRRLEKGAGHSYAEVDMVPNPLRVVLPSWANRDGAPSPQAAGRLAATGNEDRNSRD